MTRLLIGMAAAAIALGCAANQPLNTRSGSPEVTIPDVTREELSQVIANRLADRGYAVTSVSDSRVVAERDAGLMTTMLVGTNRGAEAVTRLTLTLLDVPEGVRVLGRGDVVSGRGSLGGERSVNVTEGNFALELQMWLENIPRVIAAEREAALRAQEPRPPCTWCGE